MANTLKSQIQIWITHLNYKSKKKKLPSALLSNTVKWRGLKLEMWDRGREFGLSFVNINITMEMHRITFGFYITSNQMPLLSVLGLSFDVSLLWALHGSLSWPFLPPRIEFYSSFVLNQTSTQNQFDVPGNEHLKFGRHKTGSIWIRNWKGVGAICSRLGDCLRFWVQDNVQVKSLASLLKSFNMTSHLSFHLFLTLSVCPCYLSISFAFCYLSARGRQPLKLKAIEQGQGTSLVSPSSKLFPILPQKIGRPSKY